MSVTNRTPLRSTQRNAANAGTTGTTGLKAAFDHASATHKAQLKDAVERARDDVDSWTACSMEVGFANAKGEPTFHGYGTHKPQSVTLTMPKEKRLDLAVMITVSLHDLGDDEAKVNKAGKDRATNDRHHIEVRHPDGTVERMDGIKPDAKTLFSSTDISIRNLVPGKYTISGWPDGTSAGGYCEGRVLEITIKP